MSSSPESVTIPLRSVEEMEKFREVLATQDSPTARAILEEAPWDRLAYPVLARMTTLHGPDGQWQGVRFEVTSLQELVTQALELAGPTGLTLLLETARRGQGAAVACYQPPLEHFEARLAADATGHDFRMSTLVWSASQIDGQKDWMREVGITMTLETAPARYPALLVVSAYDADARAVAYRAVPLADLKDRLLA